MVALRVATFLRWCCEDADMAETIAESLSFDDVEGRGGDNTAVIDSLRCAEESFQRRLESSSIVEVEDDRTLALSSHSIPPWEISEDGSFATWTISMSETQIQKKREMYGRTDLFDAPPSVEYVIGRTANWLRTSLRNDSNLVRALGCRSTDLDSWTEVSTNGSHVTLNIVYERSDDN